MIGRLFVRADGVLSPRLSSIEVGGRSIPPVVLPVPGPPPAGAPTSALLGRLGEKVMAHARGGDAPLGLAFERQADDDSPVVLGEAVLRGDGAHPAATWLTVRQAVDGLVLVMLDPERPADAVVARLGAVAAGRRIPLAVAAPVTILWVGAVSGDRTWEGWTSLLELRALDAVPAPPAALGRAIVAFLAQCDGLLGAGWIGAPVAAPVAGPAVEIRVIRGANLGKVVRIAERDRVVIGRSPTATLSLEDERASRNHCLLEIDPPRVWLRDLGSRNGTLLAGQSIAGDVAVASGSQISVGDTLLEVVLPTPAAPARALRCGRCGGKAPPDIVAEDAADAYVCATCRTAILDEPVVHPDYQVVRELGRGGMGAVLLAVHRGSGEQRALKVILPQAALSERARRMFLREAQVQAGLAHPNIVRVDDLREVAPGIFCMVMEYVEGENAGAWLKRHGPLDPRWVSYLGVYACEGLGHAHAQGIVHRDIKEENLLIAQSAAGTSVKVADFGLAKSYETSGLSGFTRHGDMAGTLPYMSPEQVTNFRDVRPPGDVYAMGVTLYRLLTGGFPHQPDPNGNMGAFLLRVLEDPITPLRVRNPAVPEKLATIVEKALEKDPARRYPTARELGAALRLA